MRFYEVSALLRDSWKKHRNTWEAARLIAYTNAQTKTKKKLKLTDICKFPWENQGKSDGPSREEVERLRSMSRAVLQSGLV